MKTLIVAVAAALVSAAASVGSVGTFSGVANERELAVAMPVDADAAETIIPFIEMAARAQGLSRIRAYKKDIFIPLDQAQLSFVNDNGTLTMHVAVESEYRFAKGERQAVLDGLKAKGNAIFTEALMLRGASLAR
jgi:hypothetical protein